MTSDEKYILEEIVIEEQTRVTNHIHSVFGALADRDHGPAHASAFVTASLHGAAFALREWLGPQEAIAQLRKLADLIEAKAAKH